MTKVECSSPELHGLHECALPLSSDYQALLDEHVDCSAYCHPANAVILTELGFGRQSISRPQFAYSDLLLENPHQLSVTWFVRIMVYFPHLFHMKRCRYQGSLGVSYKVLTACIYNCIIHACPGNFNVMCTIELRFSRTIA